MTLATSRFVLFLLFFPTIGICRDLNSFAKLMLNWVVQYMHQFQLEHKHSNANVKNPLKVQFLCERSSESTRAGRTKGSSLQLGFVTRERYNGVLHGLSLSIFLECGGEPYRAFSFVALNSLFTFKKKKNTCHNAQWGWNKRQKERQAQAKSSTQSEPLGGPTYALQMSPFSPLLGLHTCKNQIPRIVDSKTDVDPTSCELFLPFMCTCRIFLSSPTLKFQFCFLLPVYFAYVFNFF